MAGRGPRRPRASRRAAATLATPTRHARRPGRRPGILRNEDRAAFRYSDLLILEDEAAAPLDDVEGLVHVEMPMDRNSTADGDLLRPHREVVRASRGIGFD